jgi:hypothetical protein
MRVTGADGQQSGTALPHDEFGLNLADALVRFRLASAFQFSETYLMCD